MKKYLLLILIAFTFSGCLNYEQNVRLNINGSGKMSIKFWKKMSDSSFTRQIEDSILFNKDSIKSYYKSPFYQIDTVIVVADSVDSTYKATINIHFNSIDSLNFAKPFENFKFKYIDGATGQKIFSQYIPSNITNMPFEDSTSTITFKYTFSGEIISENSTGREKNTLVWSYKKSELGEGKTISVTIKPYKLDETPLWIYYLTGFVLLVVIIFLFKKKRD